MVLLGSLAGPVQSAVSIGAAGSSGTVSAQPAFVPQTRRDEITSTASIEGNVRAVTASVQIRAAPELIWRVLTSCADAVRFVPGLVSCSVTQKADDDSWANVQHVIKYSWYVPRLTYEFRVDMRRPVRIDFQRTSGDLDSLKGSWNLRANGRFTQVTYEAQSQLGFWVPQWLVRLAAKRDLPKMMRRLRDLSELQQG
jgi:ribosome-associated toxin RatA of RatAB toxin-antitoxin module